VVRTALFTTEYTEQTGKRIISLSESSVPISISAFRAFRGSHCAFTTEYTVQTGKKTIAVVNA
jgi:hypothetical protein